VSLKPTIIPAIAPIDERIIDEKEIALPPQIRGIMLPTIEPTMVKSQIIVFELMA
jgi:hypothetical protein